MVLFIKHEHISREFKQIYACITLELTQGLSLEDWTYLARSNKE